MPVSVPRDASVMGFDDYNRPAVYSSVAHDGTVMPGRNGEQGGESALRQQIDGQTADPRCRGPPRHPPLDRAGEGLTGRTGCGRLA